MKDKFHTAMDELYRILGCERMHLVHTVLEEKRIQAAEEFSTRVLQHRDDSRVKPYLIEGEWTGLGMAAEVIRPGSVKDFEKRRSL